MFSRISRHFPQASGILGHPWPSLAIFGSSCRRLPAHHGPAGSRQGIRAPTKWGCSPVQWPYQWSKSGENGFQWRLLDGYPPEIKHGNEKSSIHRSLVMFQPCLILSMEEILHSTLDWNMLKPINFFEFVNNGRIMGCLSSTSTTHPHYF